MHPILRFAETAYIETRQIMPLLGEYSSPYRLLMNLEEKGELIRLKNGFYVISEKIEKNRVPYEQIANLLHGPSYLSFEWALAHYGMIPEGVYVVTSTSMIRSISYKTPLATFDYTRLSHARYVIGIDQATNGAGNFLIATPEKALADLVHAKSKGLTARDLLIDLVEARRIEESSLKQLNKQLLFEISERYRSSAVTTLVNTIGLI